MARRSRRRNRRRSRRRSRRRRSRRGGQNYGSKTAKASQKYKGAHSTRATRLYDRKLANKRRMQRGPPKKAPPSSGNNLALIPTSRIPLSNPLKLSKQIGVSVSEVKAGKKAANIAANKVGDAVKGAASQAANKAPAFWCKNEGLSPLLRKRGNCVKKNACPAGCVAAGGRRSRRRR